MSGLTVCVFGTNRTVVAVYGRIRDLGSGRGGKSARIGRAASVWRGNVRGPRLHGVWDGGRD